MTEHFPHRVGPSVVEHLRFLFRPEHEWLRVACAAPFLMFPAGRPWITAGVVSLLVGLWLIGRISGQRQPLKTPLDGPVLALAIMVAVGVWISPAPELSLPKATGVLLGVLAMRAVVLAAPTLHLMWRATAVYLLVGLALLVPGLLGSASADKFAALGQVSRWIPRWIANLPGTGGAVHPNALGGTSLFFLPLLLVALTVAWRVPDPTASFHLSPLPEQSRSSRLEARFYRLGLGACTGALLALLLLSQSRTSWLSLAGSATVLAAVRWPPVRRVVGVGSLLVAVVILVVGLHRSLDWVGQTVALSSGSATGVDLSMAGRLEVWSRALDAIADFPLLGMGLGTFRQSVRVLYPLALVPPGFDIAHCHNVFLQTALDTGVPGLGAYLALLAGATWLSLRTYRAGTLQTRALALGLWGNLLAVHCFGLADAIVLGAKVGLFFWLDLGLIVALHSATTGSPCGQTGEPTTAR